jgi:hypothetical protein
MHIGSKQNALPTREILMLGTRTTSSAFGDSLPVHPDLNAVVMEFIDRGNQVNIRSFGRWLLKFKGRVVDGLRINSLTDKHKKIERWFIEDMTAAAVNPEHEPAFSESDSSDLRGSAGFFPSQRGKLQKEEMVIHREALETNHANHANLCDDGCSDWDCEVAS